MQARFIPKNFTWNKDYPSYENSSMHLVHYLENGKERKGECTMILPLLGAFQGLNTT